MGLSKQLELGIYIVLGLASLGPIVGFFLYPLGKFDIFKWVARGFTNFGPDVL